MICIQILTIICISVNILRGCVASSADELFHNYWEYTVSSQPQFATSVGDHRFNDKLNNYTVAFYEESKRILQGFQEQAKELLQTVDPNSITQTNLEVLVDEIQYKLSLLNVKNYYFPVSYLDGPPITLFELLDYQPMKSKEDFFNLVSRYNAFPRQVEEIIDLMREGIKVDMVLHERSLKNYEKQIASLTPEKAEDSMFYEPFYKISNFIPPTELEEYSEVAARSISEGLNLGLKTLSDFIQNEYRKHTRKNIASSSLPNGRDYYNTMLNYYVSDDVTPQRIHHLGVGEVERISKEMEEVIRSLGFQNNLRDFNNMIRSNVSMYFETGDEALSAFTNLIRNEIEPKLPQYFNKIPKAELVIKQVPEQLAGGGPLAYYSPATPDNSSKGVFYLDTSDLKKLPKYSTVTLTLHEAEPGHHLQTSYTNELENVPVFRKRIQYPLYAAYMEGWGLYSEYLGNEMGFYNDIYMRYGHLSEEIFRACRLVVDTGIHALGWTREQAVEFLLQKSASTEKNIQGEVDRYITWPGQACSYKYGEIKIKNSRFKAEEALGNKFDIKDFHDVVLSTGGSLNFIEKQVDRYIELTQN